MSDTTGAEAIAAILRDAGVRFAFGVAGGKLAPLMRALMRAGIRYVGLRHEASGAMAAAAIAQAGGGVAVALGEMGPGALNLAAGAGGASANRLPAVLITTNQHSRACYPGRGMFMDLDTRALFAPLVRFGAVVSDPARIPELFRRALAAARGPSPGPVHLDIAQDVLSAPAPPPHPAAPPAPPRMRPDPAAVEEAARLLLAAARPLIVAGGGAAASGAEEELRRLADRIGAAVLPTQMGIGLWPTEDSRFLGQGGIIGGEAAVTALREADVVLAVGCRVSSWLWDERGPLLRPPARLVRLDTDPAALADPPAELSLLADARAGLRDLLEALGDRRGAADPAWCAGLVERRRRHLDRLRQEASRPEGAMHPAALSFALAEALPPGALATYDGGHTSFWSNDLLPVTSPRTRLHEPGMCQLGFGLPAAIALKLLHPDRPVVNVTGDGAFGFTLAELDTARREGLPVVTIVHNNAAWGVIAHGQMRAFGESFGTDLSGADYAAIARGFGCHGEVVERPEEVGPALARAFASGLPAVLDCRVRFVPHPAMSAFAAMNRYGAAGGG
ncbi:MAG: thiamine pyrophosphate-binding protein [Acetobacteraceae bacterium]|nr:thiamine pyrophosphate-binding protein [Acetobacteraceae bacterium]